MEFFKMQEEFDSMLEVMTNPKKEVVIPEKADRRYAMCSAIVYHLWGGKNKADEEKRIDGFFKVLMKMPNDFAALMVKSAMLGNKSVTQMDAMNKLLKSKHYPAAAKKFTVSFSQQYNSL